MTSEIQTVSESSSILDLLRSYYESSTPVIVELQDHEHKAVGALYMQTIDCSGMKVSTTNNKEKYYLYVNGVGIYFTYFRKIVKMSK